jgi:hypothetical protein
MSTKAPSDRQAQHPHHTPDADSSAKLIQEAMEHNRHWHKTKHGMRYTTDVAGAARELKADVDKEDKSKGHDKALEMQKSINEHLKNSDIYGLKGYSVGTKMQAAFGEASFGPGSPDARLKPMGRPTVEGVDGQPGAAQKYKDKNGKEVNVHRTGDVAGGRDYSEKYTGKDGNPAEVKFPVPGTPGQTIDGASGASKKWSDAKKRYEYDVPTQRGDYRFGMQDGKPAFEGITAADAAIKGALQPPGSTEPDIHASGDPRSHAQSITSDLHDGSGGKVNIMLGEFSQKAPDGSNGPLIRVASQTVTDKFGNLQSRDTKYGAPGAKVDVPGADGKQSPEQVRRVQSALDTKSGNYTNTYDTADGGQIKTVAGPDGSKVLSREESFGVGADGQPKSKKLDVIDPETHKPLAVDATKVATSFNPDGSSKSTYSLKSGGVVVDETDAKGNRKVTQKTKEGGDNVPLSLPVDKQKQSDDLKKQYNDMEATRYKFAGAGSSFGEKTIPASLSTKDIDYVLDPKNNIKVSDGERKALLLMREQFEKLSSEPFLSSGVPTRVFSSDLKDWETKREAEAA